jgi:hypothetical protein
MRRLRLLLLLATAATAGCADSVINVIQPENGRAITVDGDSLMYIVSNLENVSQVDTFTWNNPDERATIYHQSFLPHGYALMVMFDGAGIVVDSTLLEYQLTTQSRAGVPGTWTVLIIYTGAWGRAQVSLVPLTGDPVPAEARASTAPTVPGVAGARRPASGGAAGGPGAKEANDERAHARSPSG